jgi:chromate reductase
VNVLGVSGGLGIKSVNTAILRAAVNLAPRNMKITVFEKLGDLPPFNPDQDRNQPPSIVTDFRALVKSVDGLIVSSPEYAHGVPGSLKNAFDWLVSSGDQSGKPLLLLTISASGGEKVHAQLCETLTVMEAKVISGAMLFTGVVRKAFDAQGNLTGSEVIASVKRGLEQLSDAIKNSKI